MSAPADTVTPGGHTNATQQHFNLHWDAFADDDASLSYLADADDDSSVESLHLGDMPSSMLEAMYTTVDDYADDDGSHFASLNLWCERGADDESETWDSDFPWGGRFFTPPFDRARLAEQEVKQDDAG